MSGDLRGLTIDPFLGASNPPRPDLSLAMDWLNDCVANHSECVQDRIHAGPTRILEINSDERTGEYVVQLVQCSGDTEPYVALSHCWGTFQPLCTTTQNFEVHTNEGIPFSSLPQSFRDAVITTTRLGLKRVWIDSLCIIQDVLQDWEYECPRMAGIYANALCTIAACDASNDSIGFLNDYPPEMRHNLGDSIGLRCITSWTERSMFIDEDSCLSTRGWVVQEKLLSVRILAFKSQRMQWQCNKQYRSDDVPCPYQIDHFQGSMTLPKPLFEANKDELSVFHNSLKTPEERSRSNLYGLWRDLICVYSRCKLTKETDKLPALSGLA